MSQSIDSVSLISFKMGDPLDFNILLMYNSLLKFEISRVDCILACYAFWGGHGQAAHFLSVHKDFAGG